MRHASRNAEIYVAVALWLAAIASLINYIQTGMTT